jgi:hypothetical protein
MGPDRVGQARYLPSPMDFEKKKIKFQEKKEIYKILIITIKYIYMLI